MSCQEWETGRRKALERLLRDLEQGRVDSEIASWLHEFNRTNREVYTTSSCSGRVAVLYGESLFDKRGARILCACHYPEKCRRYLCLYAEEASSLILGDRLVAWASLQPPIIHFIAKDQEVSERIVSCALRSGFTHSGYRRSEPCGYIVEVRVFDKLHLMLPADCRTLLLLCEVLSEYKRRLRSFLECLREAFPKSLP
jgi:tRNA wybutosine-synthesizing protein 3